MGSILHRPVVEPEDIETGNAALLRQLFRSVVGAAKEHDNLETGDAALYRQLFTDLFWTQLRSKIILRQETLLFSVSSSQIYCKNS